jgi:hypothetical protein
LLDSQWYVLDWLQNNPDLVVFATDKNLRPAITEHKVYVKLAFTDHLSASMSYKQLTKSQFLSDIQVIKLLHKKFMAKFFPEGRKGETPATTLKFTIGLDYARQIKTLLFEKALNLYLYLPPHSAH